MYLIGVIALFLAVVPAIRELPSQKAVLLDLGASEQSFKVIRASIWLYFIPPLAQLSPVPLFAWDAYPLPSTALLFVPAIAESIYVYRRLPPGGYDYQERAKRLLTTIALLGVAGIGLVMARSIFVWLMISARAGP